MGAHNISEKGGPRQVPKLPHSQYTTGWKWKNIQYEERAIDQEA